MDPRRQAQLLRAIKLRANVGVLLGEQLGTPEIVELDRLKRAQLAHATRVYVQVLSWTDVERYVIETVRESDRAGVTDSELADAVDRALDKFEQRPRAQAASG